MKNESKNTTVKSTSTKHHDSPPGKKGNSRKVKAVKPRATTPKKGTSRAAKAVKIPRPALMVTEIGVDDALPKSLPRLRVILGDYYQPVVDYEAIGNRVPFKTLTRRINKEWNLTGDKKFQDGEINAATVVIDLARDIDNRAGL